MNPHPTHRSHPVFDVESEIVKAKNSPAPVNLKPFQAQVDRVAGKTPEGKSRIRIVWGQDWPATRMICLEAWRMKYPFFRYREGGEIHDIGIPRFFVEQLHTNAELNHQESWDKARYSWTESRKVDVLGPLPEEGFYTALFQIAHHDSLCCAGRGMVRGEMCLGAYREPNDSDLERIRRMHDRREQASNDERAPSPELVQKRAADVVEARDGKWRQEIRAVIDDYLAVHGWRFSENDPTRLAHGKFHFLGHHTKSGLSRAALARIRERHQAQPEEPHANSDSNGDRAA